MSSFPINHLGFQPTPFADERTASRKADVSPLGSSMAWEPSPITHSDSLEEYRFGTIAVASPPTSTFADGRRESCDSSGGGGVDGDGSVSSSRESSIDGSVDAGWASTPSSSNTTMSQLNSSASNKLSPAISSSSLPIDGGGSGGHSQTQAHASAIPRRSGLRMGPNAQVKPIPPSLIARRSSLPSGNARLSSIGPLRSSLKNAAGGLHQLAPSPLVKSESDFTAARDEQLQHQHQQDAEMHSSNTITAVASGRSTLSGANSALPTRLGSTITRPILDRRESSSYPAGSDNACPPSSVSVMSQTSCFASPPGQQQASGPAGFSSSSASTATLPLTPDSPSIVISRPSPLQGLGIRSGKLALDGRAAPVPSGLALLQQNRPKVASAFPFPQQRAGAATPPTTPVSPQPHLTLPSSNTRSKVGGKASTAPAQPSGPLSPHLLDDHVLNPLFNARYELSSSLGSGGYGFVCIALDRADGAEVAVKFILKSKVPSHSWVEWGAHGVDGDGMPPVGGRVPMECELLIRLQHWGIVAGKACFADDKFFYLVQELHGSSWGPSTPGTPLSGTTPSVTAYIPEGMIPPSPYAPSFALPPSPFGTSPPPPPSPMLSAPTLQRPSADMERRGSCDLFECVELHKRFSENRSRMIFSQVVETVHYLASHGIYHRDIKDENIVVDRDFRVKLIDFGSAVWERGEIPTVYKEFYGTTAYASSEILAGGTYEAARAEVWSLGILLNILITGESPFASPAAAQAARRSPLRPGVKMSAACEDLIARCLDVNPETRLTIDGIRGHCWLGLTGRR